MERHFALAEAFDLGEDVPHPVAGFSAGLEFGEDGGVVGILGGEKSFEVEGGGHEGSLARIWGLDIALGLPLLT